MLLTHSNEIKVTGKSQATAVHRRRNLGNDNTNHHASMTLSRLTTEVLLPDTPKGTSMLLQKGGLRREPLSGTSPTWTNGPELYFNLSSEAIGITHVHFTFDVAKATGVANVYLCPIAQIFERIELRLKGHKRITLYSETALSVKKTCLSSEETTHCNNVENLSGDFDIGTGGAAKSFEYNIDMFFPWNGRKLFYTHSRFYNDENAILFVKMREQAYCVEAGGAAIGAAGITNMYLHMDTLHGTNEQINALVNVMNTTGMNIYYHDWERMDFSNITAGATQEISINGVNSNCCKEMYFYSHDAAGLASLAYNIADIHDVTSFYIDGGKEGHRIYPSVDATETAVQNQWGKRLLYGPKGVVPNSAIAMGTNSKFFLVSFENNRTYKAGDRDGYRDFANPSKDKLTLAYSSFASGDHIYVSFKVSKHFKLLKGIITPYESHGSTDH